MLCHLGTRALHRPLGPSPFPEGRGGARGERCRGFGVLRRAPGLLSETPKLHFSRKSAALGKSPCWPCLALLHSLSLLMRLVQCWSFLLVVAEEFVTPLNGLSPFSKLSLHGFHQPILIRKVPHPLRLVSPTAVFKLSGDTRTEAGDRQQERGEKALRGCWGAPSPVGQHLRAKTLRWVPPPHTAHQTPRGVYGASTEAGKGGYALSGACAVTYKRLEGPAGVLHLSLEVRAGDGEVMEPGLEIAPRGGFLG